jgi:DegV family protein with EDD domain
MAQIKFIADSTCDLSDDLIKALDLDVVRLYVSLGDKTYRDGEDIFPQDIIRNYERTGVLPKTAAVSPDEFSKLFEKYSCYDGIIHFSLSNRLSANFQNASIGKKDLENVYLIDSLSLSTGTSLLILEADKLRRQGKSAKEIAEHVTALRPKVQASFVVDTLEFLHKGGRCSSLAMIAGKILKIHPMLLLRNGAITVYRKFRGKMHQVLD